MLSNVNSISVNYYYFFIIHLGVPNLCTKNLNYWLNNCNLHYLINNIFVGFIFVLMPRKKRIKKQRPLTPKPCRSQTGTKLSGRNKPIQPRPSCTSSARFTLTLYFGCLLSHVDSHKSLIHNLVINSQPPPFSHLKHPRGPYLPVFLPDFKTLQKTGSCVPL